MTGITQSEKHTERQRKPTSATYEIWGVTANVQTVSWLELQKEKKEGYQECIWRNYGWKLSKPKEENYPCNGSTEGPKQGEPNKHTQRHITIKMSKVKDRTLKAARKKQRVIYNGIPKRLSADSSANTFQTIRAWHNIFEVMN